MLRRRFERIRIIDFRGDKRAARPAVVPRDENIFNIRAGVCVPVGRGSRRDRAAPTGQGRVCRRMEARRVRPRGQTRSRSTGHHGTVPDLVLRNDGARHGAVDATWVRGDRLAFLGRTVRLSLQRDRDLSRSLLLRTRKRPASGQGGALVENPPVRRVSKGIQGDPGPEGRARSPDGARRGRRLPGRLQALGPTLPLQPEGVHRFPEARHAASGLGPGQRTSRAERWDRQRTSRFGATAFCPTSTPSTVVADGSSRSSMGGERGRTLNGTAAGLSNAYGAELEPQQVFDAVRPAFPRRTTPFRFAFDLDNDFPPRSLPLEQGAVPDRRSTRQPYPETGDLRFGAGARVRLRSPRRSFPPRPSACPREAMPFDPPRRAVRSPWPRTGPSSSPTSPRRPGISNVSGYPVLHRWLRARNGEPVDAVLQREILDVVGRVEELLHRFEAADPLLEQAAAMSLSKGVMNGGEA